MPRAGGIQEGMRKKQEKKGKDRKAKKKND